MVTDRKAKNELVLETWYGDESLGESVGSVK